MKAELVDLLVYFSIFLGLFSVHNIAVKNRNKPIAKMLIITMGIFIVAMVIEVIVILWRIFQ